MSNALLTEKTQSPSQLHIKVRERFREVFQQQPPGKRISSERILAKEFGVSTATVSRALQDLQQEGILQRIPGKGTYLADSTSDNIAVSTAHFNDSTENNVLPFLEESVVNAWIIVQLEPYEYNLDRSSEFWPQRIVSRLEYLILGQGGTAKITMGHTLNEEQCVETWKKMTKGNINTIFFIANDRNPLVDVWTEQLTLSQIANAPTSSPSAPLSVVQIALSGKPQSYFDTVSFDGEWGAYLATAHLLNLGHRDIAFLAPASHMPYPWVEQRILGYHRALRAFGLKVPRAEDEFGVVRAGAVSEGPQMWQQMGKELAERLANDGAITAVLASNDQMAEAFIERATEQGKRVPQSLSVVGYDDWFTSAIHGLTTVHPPIDEIADAALRLARQQKKTNLREHVHLFLKPTLMARSTSAAPAAQQKHD